MIWFERLAVEAGFDIGPGGYLFCIGADGFKTKPELPALERFALLVAKRAKDDERERCAIVCDNVATDPCRYGFECRTAAQLATAIRSGEPLAPARISGDNP